MIFPSKHLSDQTHFFRSNRRENLDYREHGREIFKSKIMNLIMDEIMEFLKETSHSHELVQFEFDTLLKSVKNNVGISKFRTGLT